MPDAVTEPPNIDESSASIQTHLQILQDVIERMAANSSSCKTWCITIVAAILVVVADKDKPQLAWVAVLPTLLFAALDVYYLAMEKGFRASYAVFVSKLHSKTLTPDDLYSVAPSEDRSKLQVDALTSFSVWGFYVPLLLLAGFVVFVVSK
ncbi:MAG: hypothetical protein ACYTGL_05290 [Planctomycetota bacterium]|jgi:hypothetical protein